MGMMALHDRSSWAGALAALLPKGWAWTRDPASNLMRLMDALAEEPARGEARLGALIEEADPNTTLELLADWERVLALPDACQPVTGSIRERQLAVVQKLTATGGQSRAYFISLAAQLGLAVRIEESAAFTCQSACNQPVNGPDWAFHWAVVVDEASDEIADFTDAWFSCQSGCDQPLRSFGSGQLECLISRSAPAHTDVSYSYDVAAEPLLWFDFT